MGANGSTAISSSSLDISHKRQLRHQLEEHHNRMQMHKSRHLQIGGSGALQTAAPGANPTCKMKQSNSYFDLTTSHQIHNENSQHQHLHLSKQQQRSGKKGWFDTNQSEAYSISNANIGPTRPIVVLPNNPAPPALILSNNSKKSNAGVASRIHQQRQQQRTHQLKKFSDSMPSLNNIVLPPHRIDHQPNAVYHCLQQPVSQQVLVDHHKSAKHHQPSSRADKNRLPNSHHLVRRKNDPSYQIHLAMSPAGPSEDQQQMASVYNNSSQQLIKRAISLSSLHNVHNQQQHHLNDHHHSTLIEQQPQQKQQHRLSSSSAKYRQLVSSNKLSTDHQQSRSPPSPGMMNNYASRDLRMHQSANRRLSNQSQKQVQQLYNPPAPLSKKILKFKQNANRNAPPNRRYKSQQQEQQQQQQQLQQQGCPVLPPLPRSQSLHELIQLRATENGQRMRTTGTLRGPLGAPEAIGTKVNLVAELLESRRQQKISEEKDSCPRDSATMLSQSSSSDDGIHDVSATGDQSTGDSRREFSSDCLRRSSLSTASQDCEQDGQLSSVNKNSHNTGCNRKFNKRSSEQQQERPQSHQVGVSCTKLTPDTYQAQSSTLRRSQSHSALHTASSNNPNIDNDDDQSDDLNELAKFLYQFKQRQTNKSSHVEIEKARGPSSANGHEENPRITSNLQQSPNSTTSSSGFASSTCTSNSISSASSKEGRSKVDSAGTIAQKNDPSCEYLSKKSTRKKYPAPPRPDEDNLARRDSAKTKCLISGKLKLSSSLLSIVDEYNSTLQSTNERLSPELAGIANSNLATILLNGSDKESTVRSDSLESGNSKSPTTSCNQQCQQLEQLKRYTQLRQMSQSELALNHLTSSTSGNTSKNQRQSANRSGKWASESDEQQQPQAATGKHYKSKLFNLIKRISDKSEVSGGSGSNNGRASTTSIGGSAVGGHQSANNSGRQHSSGGKALKTINQSERSASHLNRDQYSSSPGGGGGGGTSACLSESLCDLNFDCDLELIKNCGFNEHKGAATKQQSGNSLFLLHPKEAKPSPSLAPGGQNGLNNRRPKEAVKLLQVVTSSSSNNWCLAPTSLSMAAAAANPVSGLRKQQHTKSQDDAGKVKGLTSKLPAAAQVKSKWSASSWLMNSGGKASSKNKQKQQPEESRKSCVTKLISNSRTPQSVAQAKIDAYPQQKQKQDQQQSGPLQQPQRHAVRATDEALPLAKGEASIEYLSPSSYAKVNSEANQLLDELDHSLDLVSANSSPFSRKVALHWWNLSGDHGNDLSAKGARKSGCDMNCSSSCTSDDCNHNDVDDDDDDNDDYTSISRAMINATLGVEKMQSEAFMLVDGDGGDVDRHSELPAVEAAGSPSDSFTFSAPNSPVVRLKSQANLANQAKSSQLNTAPDYKFTGEELLSKQQVRVVESGHQREQPLKQSSDSKIGKFICNSNHVISSLSTSTSNLASQGGSGSVSVACGSGGGCRGETGGSGGGCGATKSVACKSELRASELTANSCNLDGKRIVSCSYESSEQSEAEDAKMIMGRCNAVTSIAGPSSANKQHGNNNCTDNKHDYDNKQLSRQVVVAEQHRQQHQDSNLTRQRDVGNPVPSELRCTSASLNNNLDAGGPNRPGAAASSSNGSKLSSAIGQQHPRFQASLVPVVANGSEPRRMLTAYDAKTNGLASRCPSTCAVQSHKQAACCTAIKKVQPLSSCSQHQHQSGTDIDFGSRARIDDQKVAAATKLSDCCDSNTLSIQGQQQQLPLGQGQSTCCHYCREEFENSRVAERISHPAKHQVEVKSACCYLEKPNKLSEAKSAVDNGHPSKGGAYEMSALLPCDRCACCPDQGEKVTASQRDLHNNGFTFCRKTATSGPSAADGNKDSRISRDENKLIINKQLGACALATGSDLTNTAGKVSREANDASPSSARPTKALLDSNCKGNCESTRHPCCSDSGYHLGVDRQEIVHRLQFSQANSKKCCGNRTTSGNNDNNNCTKLETGEGLARCKVAACHHPSSKLSQTNCNEDIKTQHVCVSRDNLILKTGQKSEEESELDAAGKGSTSSSSRPALDSPRNSMHDNCACCQTLILQQQQQVLAESAVTDKDGKLIKRSGVCMTKHSPSCAEPRQVSSPSSSSPPSAATKSRLLSGATRLINIHSRNPICRSNSELVSAQSGASSRTSTNRQSSNNSSGHQSKEQQLLGKLRSSLLNRKESNQNQQAAVSGKLASSQFSLLNYCGHYVSPFVDSQSAFDNATGSSIQLNMNIDDNFILKRKTPNAGLKTRC